MAQKNTEMGTKMDTYHPAKTLDKMLNDSRYKDKIQEWWFDDTLY